MINSQIRASYWMTFPLTIVNFNHFFYTTGPSSINFAVNNCCENTTKRTHAFSWLCLPLSAIVALAFLCSIYFLSYTHVYQHSQMKSFNISFSFRPRSFASTICRTIACMYLYSVKVTVSSTMDKQIATYFI